MKKMLFAALALVGLALFGAEAQASGNGRVFVQAGGQRVVVQNGGLVFVQAGRQAVVVNNRHNVVAVQNGGRVFVQQNRAVVVRNGLFGLRQTVVVR